ncbi:SIMPL domain-containing protein [Halorientalis sp.]|uniref:SIMPL domain-containing protein n=1 Tax=Halorientalis sp. TaxID=1931229 RepID=UPI0026305098|nr:SIMPL domain-containing protein [Halorientalis sp.]
MRKTIALALAAAVVLTVGAAGTVFALNGTGTQPTQTAADGGSSQTVTVAGEGSASARPDQAVLRFAVTAEGDDPAAIRSELSSGASDLRSALSDAGVAEDDIETVGYSIEEPRRRAPPGERDQSGPDLRGAHTFEVTLADTDRAGAVVDAAAGAGAEVESIQFTLAADTRKDLRDQALESAMNDARGQADTLASAGSLSVTGVASVDATSSNYRPVVYDAERVQAGGGGTAIETGDVSVSTSVRVVYNASEA